MQGTLAPGVLPGLLRELYVGRKTGTAHFTRGAERRSVRFRRGHIADASTTVENDHMGATLLRLGILTPEDGERCTALMARDGKRMGQALQELGLMNREQVAQALAFHVREVLLKLFAWNEGSYEFEEREQEVAGEDLTQRLSTGEMILEAVRLVQDPDVVRYGLGNADRILTPSTDPLLRFQKVTLSPVDGFLMSRVDGTLSAREVIDLAPVTAEEAEKSLFGLLCVGVLEYLPGPPKTRAKRLKTGRFRLPQAPPPEPPAHEPPPAQVGREGSAESRRQEVVAMAAALKSMTHFEVLGIPRASTEVQVKEAYFRLVKRFHPDTQHDPALADLAGDIEAIFIRVGQAYETLRSARSRAQYEERLGPNRPTAVAGPSATPGVAVGPVTTAAPAGTAAADAKQPPAGGAADPQPRMATPARAEATVLALETAIRAAEKLLAQEKYWDVIQAIEPHLPEAKGRLKQRAQLLIAQAYLKNPNWVKKAEEELQQVVQADAANVEAYLLLGGIYKASGLKARALAMFRKALELKPDSEAAAEGVRELGGPKERTGPQPGVGSLLRRLFKKS